MPENFVTVATFTEPAEAEIACAHLRDAGIAAFVTGDFASGAFPGLGAISLVQLRVPEAELEQAGKILAASMEQAQDRAQERSLSWACPQCGKQADYETELCPDCGALMDPPYDPDADLTQEEEEDDKETKPIPPARRDTWVGDRLATRAFRAAVAGGLIWPLVIVVPPVLLVALLAALYSLFVLFRLAVYMGELSDSGRWKVLVAVVVAPLVILICGFLLLRFGVGVLLWFIRGW